VEPDVGLELGAVVPDDLAGMRLALAAARRALADDEVPVGAVVALDGRVIGRGWNATRRRADPTGHAEILALREAAEVVGAQRLPGAVLYCTVEPCFMCAGAASHARVARIVFAVRDPKFGACGSLGDVPRHPGLNHRSQVDEGLCADEARDLLVGFFRSKRRAVAAPDRPASASAPDESERDDPDSPFSSGGTRG